MTPHAPQNNGWMDPDPKGMWFHADEVEALESGFAKLEADLAAANATLDRLREVAFPDGAVLTVDQVADKYFAMQSIIYPTPDVTPCP